MTSALKTITSIPRDPASLGPAVHPGEILQEDFLGPMGLTQAEAARRLGMTTNRLNELIRGKRGVSADTALRLADLLGTSAQVWMHLQGNFDLRVALEARARR